MAQIQVSWIIKNSLGQIKGPFTTSMVLSMIGEGQFNGSEEISEYPSGRWRHISHYPEFYEKLLQGIDPEQENELDEHSENDEEDHFRGWERPSTHAETLNNQVPQDSQEENEAPYKISNNNHSETSRDRNRGRGREKDRETHDPESIDLENVQEIKKKLFNSDEFFRSSLLNKMIALVTLLAGAIILILLISDDSNEGRNYEDRFNLVAPGISNSRISKEEVRKRLSKVILEIEAGNVENYLEAQNLLVRVVEEAPSSLEARGLLCLAYKELWPYSKQDANDLKAITEVTKSTKLVNMISPHSDICEIVRLIAIGHYKEARGYLEGALDLNEKFSFISMLFYFKGEFFASDKDYLNAIPYLDKAGQLWSGWIAPKVMMAEIYSRTGQKQYAAQILKWILSKNPKHKESKILYGLLEYRGFKQVEKGLALLTSALSQKGLVRNTLEAEGYYAMAEIMVSTHEPKKALELARKGFEVNRNNKELQQLWLRLGGSGKMDSKKRKNNELLFLGDQFVRQGDFLSAQAEFKSAFEADPKNGMAAMKAAKALWELNQSYEAIDWLKKAIRSEPQLISAYVLQADYMTQRFDFVNAHQSLAAALKMAPRNHEVYRGLSLLEYRRNNFPVAIIYGQKGIGLYDQDVDTFIILSKANLALFHGIVSTKEKQIDQKNLAMKEALKYAAKAIEIDSSNIEAQVNYAKVASAANGVDFGINFLQEKIKRFSYTNEYKIALGDLYLSEERFSQARELYENVSELEPKNKKALIGLGLCFKALGMVDKSLKSFLKAAVVDPTDGEALFQVGILYLDSHRMNEAIDQFKRVFRMNPNFPKVNYFIGKSLFLAGSFEEALVAADSERKKNPGLADAYLLSAEIYNAQKRYPECANEYSSAIKLKAQTSEIYVRAAQCYRQSGSLDVAENMLESAMAIESGYAEIYKEQGALFETRGDIRAAILSYGKYLGLSPNAKDRTSIENHLQKLERGI